MSVREIFYLTTSPPHRKCVLDPDRSVVVVEKGSEVGAHILSGAVVDPIGLDRLVPDWRRAMGETG